MHPGYTEGGNFQTCRNNFAYLCTTSNLQDTLINRMEALIEGFDLDLTDAVEELRERSVRLKYAELRMISVYEELQVMPMKLVGKVFFFSLSRITESFQFNNAIEIMWIL